MATQLEFWYSIHTPIKRYFKTKWSIAFVKKKKLTVGKNSMASMYTEMELAQVLKLPCVTKQNGLVPPAKRKKKVGEKIPWFLCGIQR